MRSQVEQTKADNRNLVEKYELAQEEFQQVRSMEVVY